MPQYFQLKQYFKELNKVTSAASVH